MIEGMQGQKTGNKGLSPRVLVGDIGKNWSHQLEPTVKSLNVKI